MSSSARDDFLKECMGDVGGRVPLNEFNMTFCRVCANRGCSRSGLNSSVFDVRTRDWKKNLFLEVPRAEEGDEKFSNIRAKRFVPTGQAPLEIRGPSDPETNLPVPDLVPTPAGPGPADASGAEEVPPDTDRDPPIPVRDQPEPVPGVRPPVNTPFQHGTVIGGQTAPTDVRLGDDSTFVFDDE